MVVPGRASRVKWFVFAIVLAVNISVFIIWMPARLQISDRWIRLNKIWDRCEKVIFAIIDGVLNGYFIYLVRSRLIENGLTKYTPLYRMNLLLIFVSLSLDVGLVGLMSLRSSLVYLSFHPVAYLLKLQIEMKMAELITRIVRSSGAHGNGTGNSDMYYTSTNNGRTVGTLRTRGKTPPPLTGTQGLMRGSNTTHVEAGSIDQPPEMAMQGNRNLNAILRTVQTTVATSPAHKASVSESNNTHSRTNSTSALAF
ncbi:hypothetical protein FGRMN_3765 [Fusarium graminum]|nr:hypothetical protein FGRMN_3765 [Fusarium graminum]